MEQLKLVAPCHFGIESVLSGEIKRLGGENIKVSDGRISFDGDFSMVARANIGLRTAERVLICLGVFRATSFEQLFQGVKALPFENFIGKDDAFPVKGHSLNSQLHSIPDCQSIIKKAIVERLKSKYNISWFEESKSVYQIQFSIMKDEVSIMIDTSGVGLHKRGYRKNSTEAPIKETLAAGMLDIARVFPDTVFCDPFCGSGTFAIEAATKALNLAPGINRNFAFENWNNFDKKITIVERERAFDLVRKDISFKGYGFDIDPQAIELSKQNAKIAGVSSKLTFSEKNISDFVASEHLTLVMCNPPYGERLLELNEAEKLYSEMGKVFLKNNTTSYYIISPHEEFEKHFGKRADKKRKLYNGMIKCQMFMYFKWFLTKYKINGKNIFKKYCN